MLKLELPFHLTENAHGTFFRGNRAEFRRPGANEVVLAGLSISIETGGKTYEVFSDGLPHHDGPGASRGTMWPRCRLPLAQGVAIEQQMLLPAGGDAVAISWRLIGPMPVPVRLRVSPLFVAAQPFFTAGFEIEPETNGGRLAWRPHPRSSKIIADMNGRFVGGSTPAADDVIPAAFEFDLDPHPAVLIFSTEPQVEVGVDPLIGGFLAQLTEQRTARTDYDHLRDLVAA